MKTQLFIRLGLFLTIVVAGLSYGPYHNAEQETARYPEAATFNLTLDASDGQRYVMDHDLSRSDCLDALWAATGRGWGCEIG